jgi:uncharacterized phage protein gp47/JayE
MNAITPTGIQIDTPAETLDKFLQGNSAFPGMKAIYGDNINVAPNSPDGQFINLGVQFTQDMLEFISSVYASFDPNQAVGRGLDQRCAINGVVRQAGTYTYTNVTVTATQAVTINGLDTAPDAPFTVADAAGNLFYLAETYAFSGAASTALAFRAASLGAVETLVNTITVVRTITLGISAVNNPAVATSTGADEETDYALRIRRARSTALPSRGYFDGLYGALIDLAGVTEVKLLENDTNSTDANGIPSHSIWAIVAGGDVTDIARAIYVKRNAGCGMKGDVLEYVTQLDGSFFAIFFDRPVSQNLWVRATVHAITGTVDPAYIKTQLLSRLAYGIGQSASSSAVVGEILAITADAVTGVSNVAVSVEGVSTDGTTWDTLVDPTGVNYQFAIASARVTITEV